VGDFGWPPGQESLKICSLQLVMHVHIFMKNADYADAIVQSQIDNEVARVMVDPHLRGELESLSADQRLFGQHLHGCGQLIQVTVRLLFSLLVQGIKPNLY